MKKALLTGITGQDGSYLAEILLEKGYEVHGIIRRSSSFNTGRIDHLYNNPEIYNQKLFLHYGDLVDTSSLNRLLEKIEPDEIYNLGAQSHVKVSFEVPDYTAQVDGLGTLRFLDSIRETGLTKQAKFYQASTSELYGKAKEVPQNENTPFYPRSPYGVAKLYGYWIVRNYREAYDLFACNGILFNHESPRRGATFVTKKITMAAAKIVLGKQKILTLGNLNAKRDWGYAPEYCYGMWQMLQLDTAEDFVLATGITTTVRDFTAVAFKELGIELEWQGKDENEVGVIKSFNLDKLKTVISNERETAALFTFDLSLLSLEPGSAVVAVDPNYYRPTEVELLIGDASKAKKMFGWAAKTKWEKLARMMVKSDIHRVI